jgi:hypothetical protein
VGGGIGIGILNQAVRQLKKSIRNIFKNIFHRKKRKKSKAQDPDVVPASWLKHRSGQPKTEQKIQFIKNKKRIPGLLWFKRIMAGILLLINFSFSQFLLGSLGSTVQPMFIVFLGNSFILADYLWKTRHKEE